MTILSQRSRESVAKIYELEQLREIAKSVDAFAERRDQLVAQQNAFAPLAAQVRLLRGHGLTVVVPPLVGWLQTQFSKLHSDFKERPESLTQNNLRAVLNQSQSCQTALQEELARVWREYVDAKRLKLDEALLGVLRVVPAFGDAVAELEAWDAKVEAQRARVPRDDDGFEALHATIGEMQRVWDDLSGAGLPPEVVNFLRMAGVKHKGASLELLDPIRPWLKERGLEDSFRVVIVSN